MNNDLRSINTIPPFKRMCMTIGELPTSYLETMTYYEMLVWFTEYMKNTIIPTINNNGLAVQELQNKYIELKAFVDNYFDNLDVQEEINNKLDEMAESGQLTDIIAQYLGLAGMLVFNNVNEMKQATNLVNGSTCQTLGFYEINDGGKATYKIRNITNEDIVNEMDIIALNNENLIAELIINSELNIKQFGALGNNEYDNYLIFNYALQYIFNNKLKLYIPSGTYKISQTLNILSNVTIYGENQENTILSFNSDGLTFNNTNFINITNIFIKGNNNTNDGIHLIGTSNHNINLKNILIYNFNIGINSEATQVWNCTYKNMRIGECNRGIKYYQGFNLSFINFYIDRCNYVMSIDRIKASIFIGSNFSIIENTQNETFNFGGNTNIVFESCNFECDNHYTRNHIFSLTSRMIKFSNCNFLMNCASTTHVFLLYNTFVSLIFENCSYFTKTGNEMDANNFWDKNYFSSAKIGGIKFLTSDDIPRPSGLYSQQYQFYHDIGNGLPINFNGTSINLSLLKTGTILYQRDTKKLCIFDGTNVIDIVTGNIII